MEKIVRNAIVHHMEVNSLFSKKQFGFIAKRSTVLQLLMVLEDWTDILDHGGEIDVIYMDFMKAFDKVPHRRLISKLRSYGINDQITKWVEHYLNNRKQRVIVNGNSSEDHPVLSGIPQGSVLGPILFVIYINDLPNYTISNTFLFADDTKIYREIKNEEDREIMQQDLDNLQEWSNTWLLKFHPLKCKVLSIKGKSDRCYSMAGVEETINLENIAFEKDIGVLVDKDLNFVSHMQQAVNKANSIVGLIRRTFVYLDEVTFKQLFKALVRPHLEYAASVWNPYKVKDIEMIERVQRRATKLISGLKDLSYADRLKKLGIPTLAYRRLRGDMINVYKILNNFHDSAVTTGIFDTDTSLRTRGHSRKLKKKYCKLDIRKYSFGLRSVDVWNSLPEKVVQATTIREFEIELDNYWNNFELKYNHLAGHNFVTGRIK